MFSCSEEINWFSRGTWYEWSGVRPARWDRPGRFWKGLQKQEELVEGDSCSKGIIQSLESKWLIFTSDRNMLGSRRHRSRARGNVGAFKGNFLLFRFFILSKNKLPHHPNVLRFHGAYLEADGEFTYLKHGDKTNSAYRRLIEVLILDRDGCCLLIFSSVLPERRNDVLGDAGLALVVHDRAVLWWRPQPIHPQNPGIQNSCWK